MAKEWLIEVSGEASQYVAEYLQAHGESPYETEMLDVKCFDGKRRDMYSVKSDFIRRLMRGAAAFPHFKLKFWLRSGHDFNAYSADWIKLRNVSPNVAYVQSRIEEMERRTESKDAKETEDNLNNFKRVS